MARTLSPRPLAIVDALPLRPGMPILYHRVRAGRGGPRDRRRICDRYALGIDRSATAIAQAEAASAVEIASGRLGFRQVAAEDFELLPEDAPFDLAVAVRAGALDGRHPAAGQRARARIAAALLPAGRLFIDGGDPLREVALPD
jgi:hypothetical protein